MTASEIFRHILRPAPARDRRIRALHSSRIATTLCGAEVTADDVPFRDGAATVRAGWNVCASCASKVKP